MCFIVGSTFFYLLRRNISFHYFEFFRQMCTLSSFGTEVKDTLGNTKLVYNFSAVG